MVYIIGVGGVGSWLAAAMVRLVGADNVVLVDGDRLEKKNLDRQLFAERDIGKFKAEALGEQLGCQSVPRWYHCGLIPMTKDDWMICCADNNPARFEVLSSCDMHQCSCIIAANETTSSEAYLYHHQWRGTDNDPRIYYPEIAKDQTNNPMRASIGCTGEVQLSNRQLVTANFMAAAQAGHLYMMWAIEGRKVKAETKKMMPHRLNQNLTRNGYILSGEPKKVEPRKETNNE